jgi:hypothetical protein
VTGRDLDFHGFDGPEIDDRPSMVKALILLLEVANAFVMPIPDAAIVTMTVIMEVTVAAIEVLVATSTSPRQRKPEAAIEVEAYWLDIEIPGLPLIFCLHLAC